ncbi:MAG: peptide chain release factor 2 [Planctomycetaceae bacterium]|nr:peptide chain release factor 2 [Planctomycetaceae bacterium]MCH2594945.1 peptide chain release factor 2 [Pirellulales bacterium]HCK40788.1 peptide chain release factor 2 [Planctomycetaceae bacterium]
MVLPRFTPPSSNFGTLFDCAAKSEQIVAIDVKMAQPDFWNDQETAQDTVARRKSLLAIVKPLDEALASSEDLAAMLEMAAEDESFADEVPGEVQRLEAIVEQLKLQALLNGTHDAAGAIVTIHARDGGTDANDWAEMLLRMYMQWSQKNDYSVSLIDRQDNEEAGINNATIVIRGPMAYGYLRGETGIHRLVRISPFNSEGKRQTSFAAVDVSPELSDTIEIEINESEVRVDTYRASGAGGQHVNKTDSAIRLTHIPTGIVVQCQNERSQHKNRATAWKMLRSRMARLEEEQREAEDAARYQQQAKTGFGSQIRNYFLHPDQRVKDARTKFQMGNFQAVLDGDIQGFLDAVLRWRAGQPVDKVAD